MRSTPSAAVLSILVLALALAPACTSAEGGGDAQDRPSRGRPASAGATVAAGSGSEETESPQSPWVQERIDAIETIWTFTPRGRRWLETYDLRQMEAQPTWFGSHGFDSWAGVGQAIPRQALHELSHSYWGAFPVSGHPDLAWKPTDSEGVSEGKALLRSDLDTFMKQPPDRFEPLRDRFRNLPNLQEGEYPDLYHFGEADLIYMTGSDLDLVPPILRKYFDHFLTPTGVGGTDFRTWIDGIRWYRGLPSEDRSVAGEVFGLQHFPLERYRALGADDEARLPEPVRSALNREDRQRLADFALQFDAVKEERFSLVDAAGVDRGFQFWRDYVRQMRDLHREHPDVLRRRGGGRGEQLAQALDFYIGLETEDREQHARLVRDRMSQPLVGDLAVLLDARTLVKLFGDETGDGEGVRAVISGYAETLERLVSVADRVIRAGQEDAGAGADQFETFILEAEEIDLASTVNVVIDVIRATDPATLQTVMPALSDTALLRLLTVRPEAARAPEVPPQRLASALGIRPDAAPDELVSGMNRLFDNSSGNFEIDQPVNDFVFELLAERERRQPGITVSIMRQTPAPLIRWIHRHPEAAVRALRNDLDSSAALIREREGARTPASRAIHTLVPREPRLAADLLLQLVDLSEPETGSSALSWFAYDGYWANLDAGPKVDLNRTAEFFVALVDSRGTDWLADRFVETEAALQTALDGDEIEAEMPTRFASTLRRLAEIATSPRVAEALLEAADVFDHPQG